MSRGLVCVGALGTGVGKVSSLAQEYEVFSCNEDMATSREALDKVFRLKASWMGVVADFHESGSAAALASISKGIQGNLSCPAFAYVVPSEREEDLRRLLGRGECFERVFVFSPEAGFVEAEEESISRVLRVHAIPATSPLARLQASRSRFLSAQAWPLELSSVSLDRIAEARGNGAGQEAFERTLLPVAFDSMNLLTDDLRHRAGDLLQMASASWKEDLDVYLEFFRPVTAWLRSFLAEDTAASRKGEENDSSLSQWADVLEILAHGPEAEARLLIGLKELMPVDRDELMKLAYGVPETLASGNGKEEGEENKKWAFEAAVVRKFLTELPGDVPRKDRTTLRNHLTAACLRLLKILDSPFTRARMLGSWIDFVWSKHTEKLLGPAVDADALAVLKTDLRRTLRKAHGERVVIILPDQDPLKRSWNGEKLLVWLESYLGKACELVFSNDKQAWLYVETELDCREASQQVRLRTMDDGGDLRAPLKVAVGFDPASGPSPSSPSQADGDSCSACGSDLSSPVPGIPPSFEARSQNNAKPSLLCPQCQRLNGRDWWLCTQHGKLLVPVPIDKDRCPDCILRHHEDPIRHPLSSIGVRPGLAEPFLCPNCVEIRKERPWHEAFKVEEELVPFYKNGVNGHDSAKFPELAAKYGLLDGYRCPGCATLLIPVHHRTMRVN